MKVIIKWLIKKFLPGYHLAANPPKRKARVVKGSMTFDIFGNEVK